MKKFCSKCGAQLDLGKKTCSSCHAFNPYFIAGFTGAAKNDAAEGSTLSHLTSVTSQIVHEPVVQKENAAEIESMRQERLEQQKADLELKNELIKVKEETKKYKKETFDLVKEVQRELHDIEAENKLLKEKVESLNNNKQAEQVELTHVVPITAEHKQKSKRGITAMAAMILLIVGAVPSYFFFSKTTKTPETNTTTAPQVSQPSFADNKVKADNKEVTAVVKDTTPPSKLLAAAVTPAPTKPQPVVVPAPVATKVPITTNTTPAAFSLTESRLKTDLVGKKLSGCDITINNSAEINSIANLILVDRLSASYLKYKCVVKVKQGNETYTSSPYVYYSAEGTFIKVDGTNCE